jgi:large subunit ribosomal protein L24
MSAPARISGVTKVPEIRKGDTVLVMTGRDAGKRGVVDRVIRRDPATSPVRSAYRRTSGTGGVYVVADGINVAKRHTKPRQRSQGGPGAAPTMDPGGILDHPLPMPVGKVMLVCSSCDQPTRIGHRVLDNGSRVRVCKRCGEPIEVKPS